MPVQNVRQLQKSLVATGAVISEKEMRHGIFGRSTQATIKELQARNNLRETGVADKEFFAMLNPETEDDRIRQGNFSSVISQIIRNLEKIDLAIPALGEARDDVSTALKVWQTDKLKQNIINYFDTPSEELAIAIDALPVEVGNVTRQKFSTILSNTVLPELLKNDNSEEEIFNVVQSKK